MDYQINIRKLDKPATAADARWDLEEIDREVDAVTFNITAAAEDLATLRAQLRVLKRQRDQVASKDYEIWQDTDAPQAEYATSSSPYCAGPVFVAIATTKKASIPREYWHSYCAVPLHRRGRRNQGHQATAPIAIPHAVGSGTAGAVNVGP